MSEKLPYPQNPNGTLAGILQTLTEVVSLLRTTFFPTQGKGVMARLAELEQRVANLEKQP